MKTREQLKSYALSISFGLGIFAISMNAATAACTNASLVGTFYLDSVEVEAVSAGTDYCEQTGIATADGAGHFRTSHLYRRCSISGISHPAAKVHKYKVNADCSFSSAEVPPTPGSIGHGMILMKGDLVLADGTRRSASNSMKINHVVAVRTSKKRPLPIKRKK